MRYSLADGHRYRLVPVATLDQVRAPDGDPRHPELFTRRLPGEAAEQWARVPAEWLPAEGRGKGRARRRAA